MPLSAKDHVDLVTKCDERLRQNWIGFVTLTYGISLAIGSRDKGCIFGGLDPKEWIVIIYPVFAAFFIFGLWYNFLERRTWIGNALASADVRRELPGWLDAWWARSLTPAGRVIRDLWLAFRIAVVLISGEYGIIAVCHNPARGKGWFEATLKPILNLPKQGWHLLWQVPAFLAAVALVACCVLLLVSYFGRREGDTPTEEASSVAERLAIQCRHGWQVLRRAAGKAA